MKSKRNAVNVSISVFAGGNNQKLPTSIGGLGGSKYVETKVTDEVIFAQKKTQVPNKLAKEKVGSA